MLTRKTVIAIPLPTTSLTNQGRSGTSISFKNPYDLYIGHLNSDQYPYWLNGDLDEIRIYDRPLNKEEIYALCDHKPEVKEPPYVKTKEKNVPIQNAVITKTARGAYMAQGDDGKGNKLTTLMNEAKALAAIQAGIAKQGW